MKLITRDTDYALRVLCFVAKQKKRIFAVSDFTRALRLPQPFLRKILQVLNKKGMLKSFKGQGGGFLLSKLPEKIFLTDIMRIFQGKLRLNECALKKLVCPDQKTCPLKKRIDGIERYVLKELASITIASLIK